MTTRKHALKFSEAEQRLGIAIEVRVHVDTHKDLFSAADNQRQLQRRTIRSYQLHLPPRKCSSRKTGGAVMTSKVAVDEDLKSPRLATD